MFLTSFQICLFLLQITCTPPFPPSTKFPKHYQEIWCFLGNVQLCFRIPWSWLYEHIVCASYRVQNYNKLYKLILLNTNSVHFLIIQAAWIWQKNLSWNKEREARFIAGLNLYFSECCESYSGPDGMHVKWELERESKTRARAQGFPGWLWHIQLPPCFPSQEVGE